jgi:tetratricopeptide (TPR) repeat protein
VEYHKHRKRYLPFQADRKKHGHARREIGNQEVRDHQIAMNRTGLLIFLLMFVFTFNPSLYAEPGETSAGFLNLGVGARSLGMAGAATSNSQGVHSLFWNPGGLGWLKGTELLFMHAEHFQSIRYENIGMAFGKNSLGLGFSIKALHLGGIEERTGPSADPLSMMSAYSFAPCLTLAKAFYHYISVGTNLKLVYQQIGDDNASAFASDIGIIARSGIQGVNLGVSLDNIGTKVQFINEGYPLPARARTGISYAPFDGHMTLAIDVIKPFHEELEYCVGLEGILLERFALRTGYRSGLANSGSLAGISAGTGFKILDVDIDYAFCSYGDIGQSHTFSLAYIFGRSEAGQKKTEQQIAEELERRARMTAQTFFQQGIAQESEERYEDALKSYDIALIWDPTYQEALDRIGALRKRLESLQVNEHLTKGIAAFNTSNYLEALSEFGLVLEIDPRNDLATEWMKTATNALVQAHIEKIMLTAEQKKKIHSAFTKGLNWFSKQNFAKAIEAWTEVLSLDPSNAEAQLYITQARERVTEQIASSLEQIDIYISQNKWTQAYSEVEYVLGLDPDNQQALARRKKIRDNLTELSKQHTRTGIQLFNQGKFNEAATELRIALNLNPKNLTADQYLSKIKSRETEQVSASTITDLYLKGVNAYTKEDFKIAISYWERVLELDPNHENAKRNIKRAQEKLKISKK